MIDFPFFRSIGSIALIENYGSQIKAVLLSEKAAILRSQARAVANQANEESLAKGFTHVYAAVVDRPFPHEIELPFSVEDQLKGIIACGRSEDGIWEADDKKLISRRQGGPYLGVFVGPIDNKGVKACYQTWVEESFPSENEPIPSFDLIAGAALRLIHPGYSDTGLEINNLRGLANVKKLCDVMNILRKAYIALGNAEVSWNVLWMLHVDKGLSNLQVAISKYKGDDLDGYVAKVVFPSFALPNPADGNAYSRGHVLDSAVQEFWSSRDLVALSIEGIVSKRRAKGVERLCLNSIDWDEFDFTVHGRRDGGLSSSLLGFVLHASKSADLIDDFSDITEEEFFAPTSGDPKLLQVRNLDGSELSSHGFLGEIEIIENVSLVKTDSKRRLISTELLVFVPLTSSTPDSESLKKSRITLEDLVIRSSERVEVEVFDRFLWSSGQLALRVRFSRTVRGNANFKYVPKVRTLRLVVPLSDSVTGLVSRNGQLKVILLPPDGVGAIVTSGRSDKCQMIGQDEFDSNGIAIDNPEGYSYSAGSGSEFDIVIWSILQPSSLTKDGIIQKINLHSQLRYETELVMLSNPIIFEVDQVNLIFEPISTSESVTTMYYSPLRAATEKGDVSAEVRKEDREDLRGSFETLIYREWENWCGSGGNIGHIAVSANCNEDISEVKLDHQTRTLVSPEISEVRNFWPIRVGDRVEEELLSSSELSQFISSFNDLQLIKGISELGRDGVVQWISKLDLSKHLKRTSGSDGEWQQLVDNYLNSYKKLIQKADLVCDHFGKFWARYPFSVSIWDESPKRLSAVLLSPFHPLRFAWLANAEHVLNESSVAHEIRRMYAGTISGWQFPMITRSDTASGAMMAVPIDSGLESLFAGWSMLVAASVDVPMPLSIPRFAGNCNVPGVSAGGLDSSAVESAITDFCNTNPFVSTLVIDIAASSESPRNSTIDLGVVEKISTWSKQRVLFGQSSGGARVYDSVNRLGDLPLEVLSISDAEVDIPPALTWQKYDPRDSMPSANIRIMNDSEVSVEIESSQTFPMLGVVARRPLRRFEVSRVSDGQVVSEIFPAIQSDDTNPYIGALAAAESKNSNNNVESSKIKFSIDNDHAILSGADWTVVGESGLAPAALSSLLQLARKGNAVSTLWEWRPPFFDVGRNSSFSIVDRRPYLTVARIPNIFRQKLRSLVSSLLGELNTESNVSEKIDRVIRTIGARGVGLSSLINGKQRHRTHQKGALGFSMVFELIDSVSTPDESRFVIPLDAANPYLNVLAGRPLVDNGQRADLLAIEIQADRIVLVPIEIKFYRLENPIHTLPDLSDTDVLDAVEQAVSSRRLLNDVKRFWQDTQKSSGDCELMNNAVLALVDAAIRLSPINLMQLEDVRARMQRFANGEMALEIGLPVVAYLIATNHTVKSRHAQLFSPDRSEVFIADPRHVEAELRSGRTSILIEEWRKVLRNSFLRTDIDNQKLPQIQPTIVIESEVTSVLEMNTEKLDEDIQILASDLSERSENSALVLEKQEGTVAESVVEDPKISTHTGPGMLIEAPGVKLDIGTFIDSGDQAHFWPGNTNLSSLNVGVLGDMGTGKTQLCLGLVNQFRRLSRSSQPTPVSGLILDYKRDYQKPEFLDAVGGVVLKPRHLPLDIFGISGEKTLPQMNAKAMNFINIISMVFGGIGGQQRDRLRNVIIQKISELSHSPTMQEIAEAYRLENKNKADSVTEILNNFVFGEIFSTSPDTFQNLDEMLKSSVVVVDLRELDPDQRTKKTLVAVFLSKYFEYMVKLPKWPVQSGQPQLRRLNSFLLVDEAVSIMEYHFDPLHQILLQGREYGVSVVLSSQYLDHFISSEANYAQPLRTWFIHRVPNVSKKSLNELGIVSATNEDAIRIADLGLHSAFYSSFDCPGRFIDGNPFFNQLKQMDESDKKW